MIGGIGPWVTRLPGLPGYEWGQGQETLWRRIRKSQKRLARRLSDVFITEYSKPHYDVRRKRRRRRRRIL